MIIYSYTNFLESYFHLNITGNYVFSRTNEFITLYFSATSTKYENYNIKFLRDFNLIHGPIDHFNFCSKGKITRTQYSITIYNLNFSYLGWIFKKLCRSNITSKSIKWRRLI